MSVRVGARMAILVAAVTAQACGEGASGVAAPDASVAAPDLNGRWAMFAWEDPVAVNLQTRAGAIEGQGCCAGFPGQGDGLHCCGSVTGEIRDRHAAFEFSIDFAGELYRYATDVTVSTNGERMAGTFSRWGLPVAWVRIGSADAYLPPADPTLQEVLNHRGGLRYDLVLSDAPAGSDFAAQQVYTLGLGLQALYGQLGSFWSGEMSWNAADQTLVVGPVPETAPGLPVALALRLNDSTLASVEAVMGSGLRYRFQATVSPL